MAAPRSTNISLPELAAQVERLTAQLAKVANKQVYPRPEAIVQTIRQAAHGLAVSSLIRHNGTAWVKSQADSAANAVIGGMVIAVLSVDVFIMAMPGSYVAGLSGLTAGGVYYLDASTAGARTLTAPAIAVPVLHADTATTGVLLAPAIPSPVYRRMKYITRLTTGTSYTVPTTYKAFLFILIAAGAGGGEETSSTQSTQLLETGGATFGRIGMLAFGGGGGGGETVFIRWENRAAVASLTYAIGAGGAASTDGGDTDLTIDGTLVRADGGRAGSAAVYAAPSHKAGKGGLGGSNGGTPGYSADAPTDCLVTRLRGHAGEDGGIYVGYNGTDDVVAYRELASGGTAAYACDTYGRGGDGASAAGVPQTGNDGCILVFGLE